MPSDGVKSAGVGGARQDQSQQASTYNTSRLMPSMLGWGVMDPSRPSASMGVTGRLPSTLASRVSSSIGFLGMVSGSGSCAARRLSISIDPELLRAVSVRKVLANLGGIWANTALPTPESQARDFSLSESVERIDDFISHDWGTGRWVKFLSLCHVYNGQAAVMLSVLCCLALALLIDHGPLPKPPQYQHTLYVAGNTIDHASSIFMLPVGFVVFWLVFFFGQSARIGVCGHERTSFVDKVCIDQINVEKKRSGILALAGFLCHSNRLVILWTPRYFTRLWCVFEVASWLHITGYENFGDDVAFQPVSLTMLLVVSQIAVLMRSAVAALSQALCVSTIAFQVATMLPICIMTVSPMRRSAREALRLPEQLASFSISDSACFCCTNNHEHPEDGEKMPCDRKLIYMTLQTWFLNQTEDACEAAVSNSRQQVLDYFDALVRVEVRHSIVDGSGIFRMSYMDALLVSIPGILFGFDSMLGLAQMPSDVAWRLAAYQVANGFLFLPVTVKLSIAGGLHVVRSSIRFEHLVHDRVMDLILGVAMCMFLAAIFSLYEFGFGDASPLPYWCSVCFWMVLAIALFRPRFRRSSKARVEAEPDEVGAKIQNEMQDIASTRSSKHNGVGPRSDRPSGAKLVIGRSSQEPTWQYQVTAVVPDIGETRCSNTESQRGVTVPGH